MYVYIQSERHTFGGLWTVGFYQPDGTWVPESDHPTKEEAARRTVWLNGGYPDLEPSPEPLANVRRCRVCGCTDDDCRQCIEKTGEPCHWVEEDLCSACADEMGEAS